MHRLNTECGYEASQGGVNVRKLGRRVYYWVEVLIGKTTSFELLLDFGIRDSGATDM